MKALVSNTPGGPESLVLGEMPEPTPAPSEIRIAVSACAVNYPDVLVIADRYQLRPPRPFSPGTEVAGIVDAIGADVTDFSVGERVFGVIPFGGMAEKVCIPAASCFECPREMPFEDACALLMTYGTAYYGLKDRARLRAGETLLVLGAAGGIGLAAVELGKAAGARVVAVASSQDKLDLARSRGADVGILSPRDPFDSNAAKSFSGQMKTACAPTGADVVCDPVGGDYAEAALRAIAWEGRYLVVGFTAGIPRIPLNLPLLKSCQIVGVAWGAFTTRDPAANRTNTRELLKLYESGRIKPFVTARYPLERAGEAIKQLAERRALGKIVVTVRS
jgi:NADPH2:quinone reductase